MAKWHKTRGAAGMQYATVVGLLAVIAIGSVVVMGQSMSSLLGKTSNTISQAGNPAAAKAPDITTPNAVTFTAVTGADPQTSLNSEIKQITGITTAVPVIAGSNPQVNFRVCSNATCAGGPGLNPGSGMISNGEYLQLNMSSSGSYATETIGTIAIGTGSASWSITTRSAVTTPNTMTFSAVSGAAVSSSQT